MSTTLIGSCQEAIDNLKKEILEKQDELVKLINEYQRLCDENNKK